MKNQCLHFLAAVALATPAVAQDLALTPLADTYIQNGSTADFSTGVSLLVKQQRNPSSNNRATFLKFDGTGIGGGDLSDVSLTLTFAAGSKVNTVSEYQLFGILDGTAAENFNAATLTWDNNGLMDLTAQNNVNASLLFGAAPLATVSIPVNANAAGTTAVFSGEALDAFLNANANGYLSFIVTSATSDPTAYPAFASMENTAYTPATLVVPVPEPGSLTLVGLGLAGFLAVRARRQ